MEKFGLIPSMKAILFILPILFLHNPVAAQSQGEWTERAGRALLGLDTGRPDMRTARDYLLRGQEAGEERASEILRRMDFMSGTVMGEFQEILEEARSSLRTRTRLNASRADILEGLARLGNPEARRMTGILHALSLRENASPALGLTFLNAAIADGDAEAAVFMALLMEANQSANSDILMAWERAESLGHPHARLPAALYRSENSPQKEVMNFLVPLMREALRNPEGTHAMTLENLRREIPAAFWRDAEVLANR